MLVRIVNMRGVNLNVFDFDYDLTWAAFFMNADEHVYGRYGGRNASSSDDSLSLAGLKYAMRQALAAHRENPLRKPTPEIHTVEQYPAARRVKENACIHCHQVYDFRGEELRRAGKWSNDRLWVYPQPENVGLSMDVNQGNRVRTVSPDSPASRIGLRPGDVIEKVNGVPVASVADVQYALHLAPNEGEVNIEWHRDGRQTTGKLDLRDGWRKTDISWRASMWRMEPSPFVHGEDLSAEAKKALGLSEKRLAFRQGNFVPRPSSQAGIRQNDVILGIDDQILEMTMRQFNVHVRLNYKVGDQITFNLLRNGKRLNIPMTLQSRPPF